MSPTQSDSAYPPLQKLLASKIIDFSLKSEIFEICQREERDFRLVSTRHREENQLSD